VSAFAGTLRLARVHLRRDRLLLATLIAAFVATTALTAVSLEDLYPTSADRERAAETFAQDPAIAAIGGQPRNLVTLGGLVAFEVGVTYSAFVGLMSLLLVGRYTRGEEEAGRTELILAGAVGRRAPTAAALVVVAAADLAVGLGVALALVALGLPAAGSLSLGAWFAGNGILFAGLAALTAQLSRSKRAANGYALAALALAWALRAVGDAGDGTLTWLSPIGWGEEMHPFSGERWWPLALMAAGAAAATAGAFALLERREVGAGLIADRPGPPAAPTWLGTPTGLALRLARPALIAWVVGMFLFGLVYGSLADSIEQWVGENEAVEELLVGEETAGLVDAYLATALLILALIGTGCGVQIGLRPHAEEAAGRLELPATGAVSRLELLGAWGLVAALGMAAVLGAAGLGSGLGAAGATGEWDRVPNLLGGALAYLPAGLVMLGLALLLVGAAPRAAPLAWAALVAVGFLNTFGGMLDLPQALMDVSPFGHLARLPAEPLELGPLLAAAALGAALAAAGLAAFRARDVG
jgi:ABC-2 type transport system permease protein